MSTETNDDRYDVLIIGGGPAGISAAIWCADLGLTCALLERSTSLGGQLLWIHNPITNYPGLKAANGREVAEMFERCIDRTKIHVVVGASVASLDLPGRNLRLDDGRHFSAKAIVIATGVRRRKLGVLGEEAFAGRGILSSGAGEKQRVAGKKVVIVGGGDAALENALILGEYASDVVVVHRRDEFSARREFVDAARTRGNVSFAMNARLTSINGDDRVRSVSVTSDRDTLDIACDALLVRIGVDANTEILGGEVTLDEHGYVVVDEELRTNVDGLWAIGDVTGPVAMTIANAVGHGSTAAKTIAAKI